jgi:hypothetical protein
MAESWRVVITFPDQRQAKNKAFREKIAQDLGSRLDQVRVTSGKAGIFVYASASGQAWEALRAARDVLAQNDGTADFRTECWDARREEWRQAKASPPGATPEPRSAHEYRQEQEKEESLKTGRASWLVRVNMPSHRDAAALADQLAAEGWPVERRRKRLSAGANCEDDARSLAEQVRGYVPAGTTVQVEKNVSNWVPWSAVFTPGP